MCLIAGFLTGFRNRLVVAAVLLVTSLCRVAGAAEPGEPPLSGRNNRLSTGSISVKAKWSNCLKP